MLKIKVTRKLKSYDFKANPSKPSSFENNWKNNSLDDFKLLDDNAILYQCKCQSVANYCFGDMATADTVEYGDTIAPGEFTVRLFVEPRNFHGRIHAITQTVDIDGQIIDRNAMQTTADGFQNGRWLIHDRFSFKTNQDTNTAWSAGCIILSSDDLFWLNDVLDKCGCKPNDLIPGEIIEEDNQDGKYE